MSSEPAVPSFDPKETRMLPMMPPATAIRLIQALPPTDVGDVRRARTRVLSLLKWGPWLAQSGPKWKVAIYVRGSQPPEKPFWIRPPRVIVIAIVDDGMLPIYLETVSPLGSALGTEEGEKQEEELLSLARFGMNELPTLPRKGEIHKVTAQPNKHLASDVALTLARCACAAVHAGHVQDVGAAWLAEAQRPQPD